VGFPVGFQKSQPKNPVGIPAIFLLGILYLNYYIYVITLVINIQTRGLAV
jgi:hypothetical protein